MPQLDEKATARAAFIEHLRKLMDPSAAGKEDASDIFLKGDPGDIFKRLNIPLGTVDPRFPKRARLRPSLSKPALPPLAASKRALMCSTGRPRRRATR